MAKLRGAAADLQAAFDHFRQGDLERARRSVGAALRIEPDNWVGAYLQGMIAVAAGDAAEAIAHFGRAVRLGPQSVDARLALADALRAAGDAAGAAEHYRAMLDIDPAHALALFNLGLLSESGGNPAAARDFYQACLQHQADFPEAWNNLGNIERTRGDFEGAERCYLQALSLRPDFAEAHDNLGVLCENDLGDLQRAQECYRRATEANPAFAEAHFHLGTAAGRQGLPEQALAHYERTLVLRPDHGGAYNNLGMIYFDNGFYAEAGVCFERALAAQPGLAEAHGNMASLLSRLERFAEAQRHYRAAVEKKPEFARAHFGLGLNLAHAGRWDEAIAAFRRAWELSDGSDGDAAAQLGKAYQGVGDLERARHWLREAYRLTGRDILKLHEALLLPPIMGTSAEILESRRRIETALDTLLASAPAIPEEDAIRLPDTNFFLAYHGVNDCDIQKKTAAVYLRACPTLGYLVPHATAPRQGGARIRIGFASRFLYHHSVGNFFGPVIEHLAAQPDFEVVLFSIGNHDDAVLARIAAACAQHVRIETNSLTAARRAIAERALDILVYPEIGMDPFTYLLAFSHLARMQCVLQGHSVTTGIPDVDCFVSSVLIEPPDGDAQYSERLVRLPTLPMVLSPLDPLQRMPSRAELGLPEDRRVYLCPMKLQKIHSEMDAAVAQILRRDPQAEMAFVADPQHAHWQTLLQARLARVMPDVISRVRFLPWENDKDRFQALLAAADAVLDSFHHGGATTSHLCLGAGVPMATWIADTGRSRFILAYYRLMGVDDCIAATPEQYVDIALRLANDPAWKQRIVERLQAGRPRLYDNEAVFAAYAHFFRQAAQEALAPRRIEAPYLPVRPIPTFCAGRGIPLTVLRAAERREVAEPEIVGGPAMLPETSEVAVAEVYATELEDVSVFGGHSLLVHEPSATALLDLAGRDLERIEVADGRVYHRLDDHVLLAAAKHRPAPAEAGILLAGRASGNYYHWLFEFLPRLWALDQLPQYDGWPLVVDAGLHPNLLEALRRVDRRSRPLVTLEAGACYRFKRLAVISSLCSMPVDYRPGARALPQDVVFAPEAIDFLRSRLGRVEHNAGKPRRRLFLRRGRAKYRTLLNEAEIEALFVARGFEAVSPDGLSLDEQIELFSTAEVVAGPTGAGMTNLVFAPQDATAIILYYADVPHYYFSNLASALGQRTIYVFGEAVEGSHAIAYQRNYRVSLDLVDEALSRIGRGRQAVPHAVGMTGLRFSSERFGIDGDKDLFFAIVDDMRKCAGSLAPNTHWHLLNAGGNPSGSRDMAASDGAGSVIYGQLSEDLYEQKYGTLEKMMDPWVGSQDMQPVNERAWLRYGPFLQKIDSLELLPKQLTPKGLARAGWITADLGSVMDVNLIACFSASMRGIIDGTRSERLLLVEVGGGYGRLAEAVLKAFPGKATYVLLDAVPASLMYSYLYLKKACPDAKIGLWSRGDPFDVGGYDAYVMPAWHFNAQSGIKFDVSINIESMQEMSQHHVDHYGALFDAVTRPNGLIYISNARDYLFRGNWPCAETWQRVYLANTPRSWSPNHPTEVFVKCESSDQVNALQKRVLDATYDRTLSSAG